MADPMAAKMKKNVEMNSARYDLRALAVTECSNWVLRDVIILYKQSSVDFSEEEEEEFE